MKCFIIVCNMAEDVNEVDYMIASRRQFATKEEAQKHLTGYATGWKERSIIVECPKGLTYAPGELEPRRAADAVAMQIPIIVTDQRAVCPYIVETQQTENWNSHSCWKTLDTAADAARLIRRDFPNLPVRIHHHAGGQPQIGK